MKKCKYCQSNLKIKQENDTMIWYQCENNKCKITYQEIKKK